MQADDLNRLVDLPELVGQSTRLRRRGAYWVGQCPLSGGWDWFGWIEGRRPTGPKVDTAGPHCTLADDPAGPSV